MCGACVRVGAVALSTKQRRPRTYRDSLIQSEGFWKCQRYVHHVACRHSDFGVKRPMEFEDSSMELHRWLGSDRNPCHWPYRGMVTLEGPLCESYLPGYQRTKWAEHTAR